MSSHASLTIYCVYLLVLLVLLQRLLLRGRFLLLRVLLLNLLLRLLGLLLILDDLLVLNLLLLEVLLLVRGPGDRGGVVDVDPLLALGRLVQVGVLVLEDVGMLRLVIILGLLRLDRLPPGAQGAATRLGLEMWLKFSELFRPVF